MLMLIASAAIFMMYRLRMKSFNANQIYLEQEVTARTSEAVEQREIAEFLVGSIDDDGYLRRSIQDIVDDI